MSLEPWLVGIPGAILAGSAIAVAVKRRVVPWGARKMLLRDALNKIACGRPLDYLDDALGAPLRTGALRDSAPGRLYRVYRNVHVLVTVTAAGENRTIDAFSISVRDPNFHFKTGRLTAGLLDVDLAHAAFTSVSDSPEGTRLIIGANRIGYTEAFYFGNPGYYQTFLLSHNDVAGGDFHYVEGRHEFATGTLTLPALDGELSYTPNGTWYGEFRAGTRINTLTVLDQSAPLDALVTGHSWGIDRGEVDHIPE
ncbi:ETEC_3214 domain-containing protein [Amycolatopsis sp. NPDC051758]|uniref:ETEC_3214 domain-containing protein n=1 Tax=Amycolatopsis sp. NPDC051758 TaxID=3363935 RepID=UPI0037AB0BF5